MKKLKFIDIIKGLIYNPDLDVTEKEKVEAILEMYYSLQYLKSVNSVYNAVKKDWELENQKMY